MDRESSLPEAGHPLAPTELTENRAPVTHAMVGAGVVVTDRAGRVLLGRSARGGWELPGGKVDAGESFEAAAVRELAEETGLRGRVERARVLAVLLDGAGPVPRLSAAVEVRDVAGEPTVTEPHAVTEWSWHDPEHLPAPLFVPTAQVLNAWRPGAVHGLPPVHRYAVAPGPVR